MSDVMKIQFHRNELRYVTINEGVRYTTVHDESPSVAIEQILRGAGFSDDTTVSRVVLPRQALVDALALLENAAK